MFYGFLQGSKDMEFFFIELSENNVLEKFRNIIYDHLNNNDFVIGVAKCEIKAYCQVIIKSYYFENTKYKC